MSILSLQTMKLMQQFALRYIRTKFKLLSAISKKKAASSAFELFCTPQKKHIKKLPKIFEDGERLEISLAGNNVNGWRWNHPAPKKILILHGFESSVTNFNHFINPLIKKEYEVLAFDAPAHGRSGGRKITAPLYKQTILEVNRLFGPIHSFLAHSFGGLAVCLALEEFKHTEKWKLVLIAPAAETTTAIDTFFKFLDLDNGLRKHFEELIKKQGGVDAAWYSVGRALKNIRAKVLWVQDEEDTITPMSDVEKIINENHPNIKFLITSGLGHRRIYRDIYVTRQIIEFL